MSASGDTQRNPLAELDKSLNAITAKLRALNNNMNTAISSIRHQNNDTDNTRTITISDYDVEQAEQMIRMNEQAISKCVNGRAGFTSTEKSFLVGVCLVTDRFAKVLGIETGPEYRKARDKVMNTEL
ncbi:hypothetical protein LTR37_016725 [Vermiconidia calcicola]|uniref:Uncharacterized protein n=1 Tax=Vermiconidia calcicola TaxID=1690605 RepID=A0ACC3MM78_9PEZI|nr:hypothetical protein LTR37_016725 [Vermiconidia calcicola]